MNAHAPDDDNLETDLLLSGLQASNEDLPTNVENRGTKADRRLAWLDRGENMKPELEVAWDSIAHSLNEEETGVLHRLQSMLDKAGHEGLLKAHIKVSIQSPFSNETS